MIDWNKNFIYAWTDDKKAERNLPNEGFRVLTPTDKRHGAYIVARKNATVRMPWGVNVTTNDGTVHKLNGIAVWEVSPNGQSADLSDPKCTYHDEPNSVYYVMDYAVRPRADGTGTEQYGLGIVLRDRLLHDLRTAAAKAANDGCVAVADWEKAIFADGNVQKSIAEAENAYALQMRRATVEKYIKENK